MAYASAARAGGGKIDDRHMSQPDPPDAEERPRSLIEAATMKVRAFVMPDEAHPDGLPSRLRPRDVARRAQRRSAAVQRAA